MKERLTRKEAAEYLTEVLGTPVSFKTLQKYATVGGGPPIPEVRAQSCIYPRMA